MKTLSTTFVAIPGARVLLGSTSAEADRCVADWSGQLVEQSYGASFRSWISKEQPAHYVDIPRFWLAKYPVTNDEFAPFAAATGAAALSLDEFEPAPNHPVWGLDRQTATDYASWWSERDGGTYRLPTEAEWEWAARGPERLEYPFGDTFEAARCNTVEGGVGCTTSVDAYPDGVSPFGAWDMAGNVEEYTASDYAAYPHGTLVIDDLYRDLGPRYPILRGGSFALGGDLARGARRHGPYRGGDRFRYTGFRLACSERPW
jgi:formylglycine-generating enzyme required for sulfatase activity